MEIKSDLNFTERVDLNLWVSQDEDVEEIQKIVQAQ